jgi:hypothetical protein
MRAIVFHGIGCECAYATLSALDAYRVFNRGECGWRKAELLPAAAARSAE